MINYSVLSSLKEMCDNPDDTFVEDVCDAFSKQTIISLDEMVEVFTLTEKAIQNYLKKKGSIL